MKVVLILFAALSGLVLAIPVEQLPNTLKEYPRYIQIPDGEGNLHEVDLEAEPDHELLSEISRNSEDNSYFLFTRRNSRIAQTLVMNDANSIRNSNFNRNWPTVVIAHGWLSNRHTNPNPTVRNAYLNRGDANIIVVDWSGVARSDYGTAVRGVPAVGRGVGQFLRFLSTTTGATFDSMHLIGFSLGAHVVGNAGRELGGRVSRVTGLDPAGPLWNLNRQRINNNDGRYVEGIHTDGGSGGLGIGSAIGDADFFPNGGDSQPECSTSLCNHNRAWEYFASTVTRDHLVGNRCTNTLQISMNTCRGAQLWMGNSDLTKTGSGLYRVNTGSRYPY